MSIEYTFTVTFTTEVPLSALRDRDRSTRVANLLEQHGIARYQHPDRTVFADDYELQEVFPFYVAGDQMSGDTGFPVLSSGAVRADVYDPDSFELGPAFDFFTEGKKQLMRDIADIYDAAPPSWKLVKTTN